MGAMLWWRSRHKLLLGLAAMLAVPFVIAFMPGKWDERMRSITEYQTDTSAMGRLNAWQTAINVARDHPVLGGGFEFHSHEVYARYAPVPEDYHAMHSIYFQVLGEHGFVGLALFLAIWAFTWRTSSRLVKVTKGREDLLWAANLVAMVQVSLVGYLVGGTFLNLAYWDLPYYSLAILIIVRDIVQRAVTAPAGTAPSPPEQVLGRGPAEASPGPMGPSTVSRGGPHTTP
jgi:probable O-glycosylation ligase (exosortase A-associated)